MKATSLPRTVDVHAHVIVPGMTRASEIKEEWRARVFREDGRQIVEFRGQAMPYALQEFVEVERILEAQQARGIDAVLLSPWVVLLGYGADLEEGVRISRVYNKGLAEMIRRYPGRVTALGTVPLQDPGVAARELEEVVGGLGLRGVEVAASVRGVYLGDDRFRPFWDAAEATGALVFIHPTTEGFSLPVFEEYFLAHSLGNPLETTICAAHLIFAGVMETHPRLKVLLAHGGGAILSLLGRLQHAHQAAPAARMRLREAPEESLKRFYFDIVTYDAAATRRLVAFAGADHVLLGSDYPFNMGLDDPIGAVHELGLGEDETAGILSENARRLLGFDTLER